MLHNHSEKNQGRPFDLRSADFANVEAEGGVEPFPRKISTAEHCIQHPHLQASLPTMVLWRISELHRPSSQSVSSSLT